MLLLSLNIRGIGGSLKVASVRRLLDRTRPNIVFFKRLLQMKRKREILCSNFVLLGLLSAVNSLGTSGGLLVAWDPNAFDLTPFFTVGGILLTGSCIHSKKELALLNIYGPCKDRKIFWNSVSKQRHSLYPKLNRSW
jgi:hypothetical protein